MPLSDAYGLIVFLSLTVLCGVLFGCQRKIINRNMLLPTPRFVTYAQQRRDTTRINENGGVSAAESARCLEISESCNPIDELAKVGRSTLREGVGVGIPRLKHLVFVSYNSVGIRLICADNRALKYKNRHYSRSVDVDHHNDRA